MLIKYWECSELAQGTRLFLESRNKPTVSWFILDSLKHWIPEPFLCQTDGGSGGKWNKQRAVVLSQGEAVSIAAGTLISFQTPKLCCITLGEGRGSRASVVQCLSFVEHFEQSVQAVAEMNGQREFAAGFAQSGI